MPTKNEYRTLVAGNGPKQLGQSVSCCKAESWVPGLAAARGPIQLETKTPCEDSITPEDSLTDLIGSKMGALHIIWQIVMLIPASNGGRWGGVGIAVITICHENHHLHLRGGASGKEDSASPREDKILPRTCISFFHT